MIQLRNGNMNVRFYFIFAILILFLFNTKNVLAATKMDRSTEDSIQEVYLFENYYIYRNIDFNIFYSNFIQQDYTVGARKEHWIRKIEKVQFNNDDLFLLPDTITEWNLRCIRNDSCEKSKYLVDGYGFSGKNLNLILFSNTKNKSQISKTEIGFKFNYTEKFHNVSYRKYGFLNRKKEFGYKTLQPPPNWNIAPQHYYAFTIKVPEEYKIVDYYPRQYLHSLDNNKITWNFYGSRDLDISVSYEKSLILMVIEFLENDDFLTLILIISTLWILLVPLIRWDLKIKGFFNDITRENIKLNGKQIIFGIFLMIVILIIIIFGLWNFSILDGIILFFIFFWIFYLFSKNKK